MSKFYCPYIQNVCEDGFPTLQDHQCVMFDEQEQVCLMKENLKLTVAQLRFHSAMRARFQLPSAKDPLDKMLKGVNSERRGAE